MDQCLKICNESLPLVVVTDAVCYATCSYGYFLIEITEDDLELN